LSLFAPIRSTVTKWRLLAPQTKLAFNRAIKLEATYNTAIENNCQSKTLRL
jgi:hypothetical protein